MREGCSLFVVCSLRVLVRNSGTDEKINKVEFFTGQKGKAMKASNFEININMDNSAFGDCQGLMLAKILHNLAEMIDKQRIEKDFSLPLWDVNGNKVGRATAN